MTYFFQQAYRALGEAILELENDRAELGALECIDMIRSAQVKLSLWGEKQWQGQRSVSGPVKPHSQFTKATGPELPPQV